MGMTILVHTIVDRDFNGESDDHSLMLDYSDVIDELCETLNVTKLSNFFDYTDQEFSYDDFEEELDEDDDSGNDESDNDDLDPDTGLAYGIDDMTWHESSDGIDTLKAIKDAIKSNRLQKIDANDLESLIEEIDDCLNALNEVNGKKGKFHFAVIE